MIGNFVNLGTYWQFTNAAWDWIIQNKNKKEEEKEKKIRIELSLQRAIPIPISTTR